MANLFVYGSLRFPDVFLAVTGVHRAVEAAQLPHHEVRALRQQVFPGLLHAVDDVAMGALYRGLSAATLRRLDVFEGNWYVRRRVIANSSFGRTSAFVYYLARPQYKRAGARPWDPTHFDAHQRRRFAALWRKRRRHRRRSGARRADHFARVE